MVWVIALLQLGGPAQAARFEKVRCAAQVRVADAGVPYLRPLVPPDAGKSRFILAMKGNVAAVVSFCSKTKIIPAVVVSDSVAVVNFLGRKLRQVISHIEPRETVQEVFPTANTNPAIPMVIASRHIADMNAVTRTAQVDKNPGLWIVAKECFQVFLGQFHGVVSHVWDRVQAVYRCLLPAIIPPSPVGG